MSAPVDEKAWLSVPGFPAYERTRFGEYRSWKWGRPRAVKPNRIGSMGYLYVRLYRDGAQHALSVAEGVLEDSVGPRPEGMEVCHFPDNDVTNNHPSNLMWGTHRENNEHKRIHGTLHGGAAHSAIMKRVSKRGDEHRSRLRPETVLRGEESGRAVLTEADVIALRALEPGTFSFTAFGREHGGICGESVRCAYYGKSWKHLPGARAKRAA